MLHAFAKPLDPLETTHSTISFFSSLTADSLFTSSMDGEEQGVFSSFLSDTDFSSFEVGAVLELEKETTRQQERKDKKKRGKKMIGVLGG